MEVRVIVIAKVIVMLKLMMMINREGQFWFKHKYVGVKECMQPCELNPKFKNLWDKVVNAKLQLPST